LSAGKKRGKPEESWFEKGKKREGGQKKKEEATAKRDFGERRRGKRGLAAGEESTIYRKGRLHGEEKTEKHSGVIFPRQKGKPRKICQEGNSGKSHGPRRGVAICRGGYREERRTN